VEEVNRFLAHLEVRGRSRHTQRGYALGLVDLLSWLASEGLELGDVDRHVVERYIAAFRSAPKAGAARVDVRCAGQVNPRTRKAAPEAERQPRTVNHRLSVLASFFSFLVERDEGWAERGNPVPLDRRAGARTHGMPGRDAPRRGRPGELRQRVPRLLPPTLDASLVAELLAAITSARDKAIVTLLWRTGQRIGDWGDPGGRHGVLGVRLADLDQRAETIVVRLKGARDEHRVPVAEEFWPLFARYVADERGLGAPEEPAWTGLRKGRGRPLSYAAFESSLRYAGRKIGANVNAHMFRHTLAQALVQTSGLKVAQEVLGHRHLSTTADAYARVDLGAMVAALELAHAAVDRGSEATATSGSSAGRGYVFPYDEATIAELERVAVDETDRA